MGFVLVEAGLRWVELALALARLPRLPVLRLLALALVRPPGLVLPLLVLWPPPRQLASPFWRTLS